MKKLLIVLLVILLLAVLTGVFLAATKDQLARIILVSILSKNLGCQVDIGALSLGSIKSHSLEIRDFKLHNPAGFPAGVFLNVPEISVDYDLQAFLKRRIHLNQIKLDLKEIVVIRNKDGRLNINTIKKDDKQEVEVDRVILSVGRVVNKDFTTGKPTIRVYAVNIKNKQFKEVTSFKNVLFLMFEVALESTPLRGALIYTIASASGMAAGPLAVVAMFTKQDKAEGEFAVSFAQAYAAATRALNTLGQVRAEDKSSGLIAADISSRSIIVNITPQGKKTKVTVRAKDAFMHMYAVTAGVLYEIEEELE